MGNRPNIVVVMSDDHAQWALGCYGNRDLHTPTLDYLAESGVRMLNAYTTTPVCSPSRASLFTGRLASQHGVHDFLAEHRAYPEIRNRDWLADELTLAEIFRQNGYQTALSGKWHVGRVFDPHPGFDEWYALDAEGARQNGRNLFWHNGKAVEHEGYTATLITDHAIDFLRDRDPDRPFFLFVGHVATHAPHAGFPDRWVTAYQRCTFQDIPQDVVYPFGRLSMQSLSLSERNRDDILANYYASVSVVDEQMGRLIDELDNLGIRQNTLLVYTSDHGYNCSHHGVWGKGNATRPLNMLEESIRIPMIFNQPGGRSIRKHGHTCYEGLFRGQVRQEPVNHCDLFQTLLDYANVELPSEILETRRYPGRSFRPLLEGDALPNWASDWFGEYGNLRMIRTRTHKLLRRYPDGPHEIFDLERDPRETTNLFGDENCQSLIQDLTKRLEDFFHQYEDAEKTGLRVWELPVHNPREAWRD